jgi:hypothetical protein
MDLTAEQEAEARRIYDLLKDKFDADLLAMARLLASKETGELFGRTEFEVRDRVHAMGSKAIEGALEGRKKGGTSAPASPAASASARRTSRGTRRAGS